MKLDKNFTTGIQVQKLWPSCFMRRMCGDFYRTRVRSLFNLVTNSLTHSLTHSCLVNLIDVILACEDVNSKLVEVVTVVDVDDEDCVGNSLLQIWKLNFGHKAKF